MPSIVNTASPMLAAIANMDMAKLKNNFRLAFGVAVPVEHVAAISNASIINSIINTNLETSA
jgi:hypothetical protein